MFLMADESVRVLNNRADADAALALAGPAVMEPTLEQVSKPIEPYRLMIRDYWRYLSVVRGSPKGLVTFRLAPDKRNLFVDFRHPSYLDDDDRNGWRSHFQEFIKAVAIEHVEVRGMLNADELRPFLQIVTIKRLTITGAEITDDKETVLATARKEIVID